MKTLGFFFFFFIWHKVCTQETNRLSYRTSHRHTGNFAGGAGGIARNVSACMAFSFTKKSADSFAFRSARDMHKAGFGLNDAALGRAGGSDEMTPAGDRVPIDGATEWTDCRDGVRELSEEARSDAGRAGTADAGAEKATGVAGEQTAAEAAAVAGTELVGGETALADLASDNAFRVERKLARTGGSYTRVIVSTSATTTSCNT